MKIGKWQIVPWPHDSEYAKKVVCWLLPINGFADYFGEKVQKGIYLIDEVHFHFTCSFGPNSEDSYSGCTFGHDEIKTLDDAKKYIEKVVVPKIGR